MKLFRWGREGLERMGLYLEGTGEWIDVSSQIADLTEARISALVEELRANPALLATNRRIDPALERIGSCIETPSKIVCVGLNYSDHAAETGQAIPTEPILFLKAPSSICGPFDPIFMPPHSSKLDWEVELGVVIGRKASNISAEEAAEYILGFCVVNDVSERSFQVERGGQWTKGKSYDHFCPVGPWLVTPDEIDNIGNLDMWTYIDGVIMQDGNTATMIFGVPEIVSYVSQFMTLHPGDLICTGTPPGVGLGKRPPVFLSVGQKVRAGIDGLGEQKQRVIHSPYGVVG